ncbi:hypothetical protein P7C71_g4713, partial [Lecanoromycetidae sp. Uapishka_2]
MGFKFSPVSEPAAKRDHFTNIDGPLGQNSNGNENNGGDGPGQMTHFTTQDKLNIFRLPVAWQYLVNNQLGGTLDATNFGSYDKLVQACLRTSAHCIIDIHNYARWNGNIIGQTGGPSISDFSGLWKQLATKYATESKVVMGLMNEPHDLPSLNSWAGAVQAAVTAIRGVGASSQMILLPGNGYTGASTFVSGGSAAALAGVTNPDGSTTNLIFDVHQYLDSDYSGTHASCVTNGISTAFQPLANWLKSANRQALLSETGGGSSDQSCITNVCAALDFLNDNSDVFLGYVGWAAGSFQISYVLSLVPTGNLDVPLMTECFAGKFGGGAGTGNDTTTPPSSPAPVSSAAAGGTASPSSSAGSSPPAALPPASGPSLSVPLPVPLNTGTVVSGAAAPTGTGYLTLAGSGPGSAGPAGWRWTGQQSTEKQQGGSESGSGTCNNHGGNANQKIRKRRGRARKVRFAYEEGMDE